MKKTVFASALMAAALMTGQVHAEGKFAVVDVQRAVSESEAARKANERVQAETKPQTEKAMQLRKEIGALEEKFKKDQTVMSDAQKRELQQQAQIKVQEAQSNIGAAQKKAQELQQQFQVEIEPKLKKILEDLRKAGGYDLIFHRDAVADLDPALDLTKKVTEKLNQATAAAK